jgi:predicted NAD/FAD-binding protein
MNGKIAIIGGGIAGLTAGYLLHPKYDVTLFEKSDRIGGNAFTLTTPDGQEVDIAAAAFGRSSYKNLFSLFRKLKIETIGPLSAFRADPFRTFGLAVSFLDLQSKKGLYFTPGFKALISQRFDILRPANLRSVLQLSRGLRRARAMLAGRELQGLSVEEALKKMPEFTGDAKLIFTAGLCLISSMHCNDVLDAPARFFIEKLKVYHDLLPPRALFSVHFPRNRTKSYVDALSAGYRDGIILNAKISTVTRRDRHITISMEDGKEMHFEKVIFACNADQALHLLADPTSDEKRVLGSWKYTEGRVVVHTDHTHFPRKELMEGYTFLYKNKDRYIETSVSGSLWALPGVSRTCGLISTQHPNFPIDKDRIVFEKVFRTPIFDFNSCSMAKDLPSLNGINNTYYCGSHFGFGLHEDAVTSAIEVGRSLGVDF